MKLTNLEPISIEKAVLSLDIKDLVKTGLYIEDFEIKKEFNFYQIKKTDKYLQLLVLPSEGYNGNIDVSYVLMFDNTELGETVHISQEVGVHTDSQGNYFFVCPLDNRITNCTKLYLREDYPLLGSKEALNLQ